MFDFGAADGSNPRFDVIKVSTSSVASVEAGTPAADPAKPEIDPLTELELTFIHVDTSATTPTDVTVQAFYLEDAGDPAEWDATENTGAARITLASTADPLTGTKSILFNAVAIGDTVTLTAGAGNDFVPSTMETFEFHIKPTTWATGQRGIRVAFFNGADRISRWVRLRDGRFGFDRTDANYQTIGIPANTFLFDSTLADSLQLDVYGGTITAQIDDIRAQTGVTPVDTPPGTGGAVGNIKHISANYTALASDIIYCDSSGGAFTITLPASPAADDWVWIWDTQGSGGTNNITVGRNGETILDVAADFVIDQNFGKADFSYEGPGTDWKHALSGLS